MTERKAADTTESILMRRRFALNLRQKGYDYHTIAKLVIKEFGEQNLPKGYDEGYAYRDISILLRKYKDEIRESAPEVAWIELDRFDDMLAALWPKVQDGDVAAITAALKISSERRKLMGIDQDSITNDWRIELGEMLAKGAIKPEQIAAEFGDEVLSEILAASK